jgi:AraC-like DNA-binding protein
MEMVHCFGTEVKAWAGSKVAGPASAFMAKNLGNNIGVGDVAAHLGLTPSGFSKSFKKETGLTPADCLRRLRCEQAGVLLGKTGKSITTIAFELGFSSSQYFASTFRKYTGMTPGQYRKKAL